MNTPEVLRAAAVVVRKGHCKRVYARDASGREVDPQHPDATQWCALGAIAKVTTSHISQASDALALAVGCVSDWNDATAMTGEQVAAMMEGVATELEGRQA